jgi:aldose 1-epimerase
MARFTTEHGSMDSYPLLILADTVTGLRVRIARLGATVLAIELPVRGVVRNIADGHRDAQELSTQKSSRFAIMEPFANRVADARYRFDGKDYDLLPGAVGAEARAIRHGFLRNQVFDLASERAGDDAATVTLSSAAIRPQLHAGYPFALDVAVTFTLDVSGLSIEAVIRNVGEHAAPCFFGWHPYFRLDESTVDSWELQIPADTFVVTDADFIPLPGAAARQPMDQAPPELDFRRTRPIGAVELNHGFTDLRTDADGRARTRLRDPASGVAIAVWQRSGVMLAFTADTVPRDPRRAVALEPMESMADAFNREDCAQVIRLEPGAERRFVCGVEVTAA